MSGQSLIEAIFKCLELALTAQEGANNNGTSDILAARTQDNRAAKADQSQR
jgi:hypothetical protein